MRAKPFVRRARPPAIPMRKAVLFDRSPVMTLASSRVRTPNSGRSRSSLFTVPPM
jgi:hypothetical protein